MGIHSYSQSWQIFTTCSVLLLFSLNAIESKPADHIVNPHPFTYHRNNEQLCTNNTDTLIWIHTAPSNHQKRCILRDTWANPYNFKIRNVAVVFFVGLSQHKTTQTLIEYESEMYNDIVQSTYIDSYRNLTYKAIAGCKWMTSFCPSAKYVVKADDDMMVDIYLLFRHLHRLKVNSHITNNSILCDVWRNRWPDREGSKWKVTKEEYSEKTYPTYCPGLGLVMTGDVIPKLYNASLYEPYFWIDDVYFTGLLARNINATFHHFGALVHFGSSWTIRQQTSFNNEYTWIFYHIHEKPIALMMWDTIYNRELRRIQHGLPTYA